MKPNDLTTPMRKAILAAAGHASMHNHVSDRVVRETWRAFTAGWSVVIDRVSSRTELQLIDNVAGAELHLPIFCRGVFIVYANTGDVFHGGADAYVEVLGLSKKLRVQQRRIPCIDAEDFVRDVSNYKQYLPDLSVYGVPWEIAWIKSKKARWEAIRAYRKEIAK